MLPLTTDKQALADVQHIPTNPTKPTTFDTNHSGWCMYAPVITHAFVELIMIHVGFVGSVGLGEEGRSACSAGVGLYVLARCRQPTRSAASTMVAFCWPLVARTAMAAEVADKRGVGAE